MSELQIALIAIGALIILAVLIINWWQEKRFHNQVEKSFSPLQRDALLDDNNEDDLDNTNFEPSAHEPNFDVRSLNEPKFHTNAFDNSSSNTLDNRANSHFSIDEATTVGKPQLQTNDEESDRFVELPNENAAELLMQEEESIDDTYSELINSKLDRLVSQDYHQQAQLAEVESARISDSKAVFNQTLTHQEPIENPVEKNQQAKNPLPIETSFSLPEMLHGQMDLTALLYLSTDTPVSTLNQALTSLFDHFDKPIFVHVLDANKQWHLLKEMQSNQEALNRLVSKVACSMQLADRGGAVDRSTLNRFQLAVETLGLDINGHVEWQNAGDALNTANSLDLFCIEVDKTIGFHLVHGDSGAFTGTKLRGLAEAQGLTLASDGAFKYFDQSSDELANKQPPSFVMFNREDHPFSPEMLRSSVVKGITFQLDIPHVKQSAETFNQMVQVARQMEIGLNATLVDSNNKLLGDIQVEKIRQQIKVLQATMLVRGIVPGSDSAHRLFS
ncbi:cell division protein ZipA C-terminal FtsZ-binding domain-containing protein [Methylotenera sp.]|uniref:cell division protein ZipA C-terminal FtsZ-binding domain-containing protein n=1 Tax=Methylotenera sp. TaxID=2051956 RepID=UPI002487307B|nr:cell division protein ZipA C-terminal FtsZ-binding domain-containing protein [Methylotenera sp.]MDI1300267.1 cell division protein ZipA C-terminal FtsZ-binding domain-containing protein [Methylotenera sp.]